MIEECNFTKRYNDAVNEEEKEDYLENEEIVEDASKTLDMGEERDDVMEVEVSKKTWTTRQRGLVF